MKPIGLWTVGIWCLVRGVSRLYGALRLFAFLPSHHGIWPRLLFTATAEGLIWMTLGVGLLRRSNTARLATVAWCGWEIAWSSYGFAAIPLSRIVAGVTILYGLGVLIDSVIIWYLFRSTSAALFMGGHERVA